MWNKSFSRKEASNVAKIVAVANQKGGVGKTTTAVNLSSCVAALGKKVLIVDLDPQGNTTTGYGISKRSVDIGTYEILIGEADARQAVRKTEFRTDVIGSNTRLAGASLEMIDLPGRESRLRKALASIQQDYDFIFIDCPPSLDLLTLNGLCACDSILIPVQCEYYALEGLSELVSTLKTVRKKYNAYLDIEGVGLKTIVTVPSARSLEPVDLPLDLSVDEVFMTREQWSSMEEERDEEILVLDNDTIDLTNSIDGALIFGVPTHIL